MENNKNVNQMGMDEAAEVESKETERKGLIARAADKVKNFGEEHPVIATIGKGLGVGLLGLGCFVLGKNSVSGSTEEHDEESEYDESDVMDEAFDDIT